MQTEAHTQAVTQKVNALLAAQPSHFLVEVRIKPTNNIKVFIDGDEGIPLASLVQYNRQLHKDLEESGMFPDDNFSLEVSSPGLDEPLKLLRQYKKNIGRYVEVLMNDGSKLEGKLVAIGEESIEVTYETGKGKKKEVNTQSVLFNDIKSTKIQVKF